MRRCHEDSPVHGGASQSASRFVVRPELASSMPLWEQKSSSWVMITNLHPFVYPVGVLRKLARSQQAWTSVRSCTGTEPPGSAVGSERQAGPRRALLPGGDPRASGRAVPSVGVATVPVVRGPLVDGAVGFFAIVGAGAPGDGAAGSSAPVGAAADASVGMVRVSAVPVVRRPLVNGVAGRSVVAGAAALGDRAAGSSAAVGAGADASIGTVRVSAVPVVRRPLVNGTVGPAGAAA